MRLHSGSRAPEEVYRLPRRRLARGPSPWQLRSILYPLVCILDQPVCIFRFYLRVRHVLLLFAFFWGAHQYGPIDVPIAWSDVH